MIIRGSQVKSNLEIVISKPNFPRYVFRNSTLFGHRQCLLHFVVFFRQNLIEQFRAAAEPVGYLPGFQNCKLQSMFHINNRKARSADCVARRVLKLQNKKLRISHNETHVFHLRVCVRRFGVPSGLLARPEPRPLLCAEVEGSEAAPLHRRRRIRQAPRSGS